MYILGGFVVPKFFLEGKLDVGRVSNATCNNSIHCRCLVNKSRGQMVASLQKFLKSLNKYQLLEDEF
jgi:hypothetical protein